MLLEPGQRLAHYRIVRQIGQGGMGAVFLAEDIKLDRRVALKVLPPETASSPDLLERFQREARTVAALNHPHIVTLYSVEEEAGTHFLTMELVEGESLDHGLPPGGLPLVRVFDIGIALADALAAAHEKGIIHRDLKPANVMVTRDGRVKVLDFGLAKFALGPATPASGSVETSAAQTRIAPGDRPLTGAGLIVGTVPYMSPEQVKGRIVDARSDIFSLGVVLYELATGRRPFGGDTPAETISSILRDVPRRVTEARHDVPRHLERIIDHCLKKEPRERFQTALGVLNQLRDLRQEVESGVQTGISSGASPAASSSSLPGSYPTSPGSGATMESGRSRAWLWAAGGAAVVLVAIIAFWMGTRRGSEPVPSGSAAGARTGGGENVPSRTIDSIAVLPFAVPPGDTSDDFLGDGIAENVTNNLTTLPGLRVVPRSVAFRERGRDDQIEAVAKDLGVRAIVTGRVNRRGDRLIVGVELTDATGMSQIWGDRFDTPIDEILTVESAIASRITDALRIEISGDQARRTIKRYTEVPAAHLAYMEARHAWGKRSAAGFRTALELYDKAIAADPNFALAHASKAETYVLMMLYLGPPADYVAPLRREVAAALRIDPDLAQAYPAQGFALVLEMRWADAELAFRRAIELDPDYATAHHWLGVWLLAIGDADAGRSQVEQARRLDPGSAIIATDLGNVLRMLGRVEEAEKIYDEVLEADPTFWRALEGLASIQSLAGRDEDAARTYERSTKLGGEIAWSDGVLAMAYGQAGDMDRARQELRGMERRAADGSYVSPFGFARAYMGMGDMDHCFQWLDRALTERDPLLMIGLARWYPEITADPRWPALEARMNYPKRHG